MDYATYERAVKAKDLWEGFWPDPRDPSFQPCLTKAKITAQDFEKAIVCLAAWRVGHKNLYRAMMSAAHVFRNRSLSGKWTDSIYSCAVRTPEMEYPQFPYEQDTEFQKMLEYVDRLYADDLLDTTEGSTFYYGPGEIPDPKGNLVRKSVAGALTFYAEE